MKQLFLFLSYSIARFFLNSICAACNIFLPTSAWRNFFFFEIITHALPFTQKLNGWPLTNISYLFVWSKKPANPANPVAMPSGKTEFNILLMNILLRKNNFLHVLTCPRSQKIVMIRNLDASKRRLFKAIYQHHQSQSSFLNHKIVLKRCYRPSENEIGGKRNHTQQ